MSLSENPPPVTSTPRPAPPLPGTLRAEIAALYAELERRIAALGVGCWVHGRCCDFERCDHRLFASSVEVAYVLDKHGAAPLDGRASASPLCPFWHDGRCHERERRPLGCRTYFCDSRFREPLQDLYEEYHRRLAGLARRHGLDWRYAPFVETIRAPSEERSA